MGGRFKLRSIYLVSLTALVLGALAVFVVVDTRVNQQQMEDILLEEARTFAREMDAVWDFMDNVQRRINYTSEGQYEFKGLHCAIVGKSVGTIFSAGSDYKIRYVNFNPRNILDKPDEFEARALEAFNADPAQSEHYGIGDYEGQERFRYIRALKVDERCLECHGEPAGTIDVTGYPREGWTLDSVGGAISMVIPLDQHRRAAVANITRDTLFFLGITMGIGAVVYAITSHFVLKPLNRLKGAFGELGEGEMGVALDVNAASREVAAMIVQFNAMATELKTMYGRLEDQVAERTADLYEANAVLGRQRDELARLAERLGEESRFKSDLLSMVNHELRTPLTSIIALAQVSKGACRGAGASQDERTWGEIEKNGTILLEMINNMLDVARADAGAITATIEPMDLGDVAGALRTVIEPLARKYKVSFATHVAADVPLVEGDYDKTLRIVENLASNAVKFTPDGGRVEFSVCLDGATGDVRMSMADTGIGIAPEDRSRIFEKFYQVNSTSTRKYNGSGLGLALVEVYASIQGFSVEVASEVGVGSTFTVVIPAACTIAGEQMGDG